MRISHCIALVLMLIGYTNTYPQTPRVILCTYYTDSHKKLATEWLLPSIKDNFEIIIGSGEQHCPSATYLQHGWTKTTKNKVEFIVDTIENNLGSIVIFADADIVLFRPIKNEIISLLETKEFVVQLDSEGKLCSGFFALRANNKTLKLWQEIGLYMQKTAKMSDQGGLNHFLSPKKNIFDIEWDFLPTTYFGGGTFRKSFWYPGKKLHVPDNPAMFHANWTRFSYKIAMLTHVTDIVKSRRKQSKIHESLLQSVRCLFNKYR